MTGKNENACVQALYRDVNERIAAVCRRLGEPALEILCECGTPSCAERVRLAAHEYERLRSRPTHFAVLCGHEDPAVEDIVWTRDGYLVVANDGVAASVARQTDPRSGSR